MITGKELTVKDYHERINKVLLYVNNNLDENLDLDKLAAISNFSPFHFHRIMRAHINEPLGSYIIRRRLDTAAGLLTLSGEPVNEIANKIGYDCPASLTKAFKKRFNVSPAEYRENKSNIKISADYLTLKTIGTMNRKPKIKELKPKKVIYIQSIGDYKGEGTKKAWDNLCTFAKKHRLFGWKTEFIGISHDDPKVTESEKLRYEACIAVRKDVKPDGEVGFKEIPGGKYAIFLHKGPYENFNQTYNEIFQSWFPTSGCELRNVPCYEVYLNSPGKTKPEKLKTEIYVPVV